MNRKKCSRLWLYFSAVVFITVASVFLIITALWYLLFHLDVVRINPYDRHVPIVVSLLGSALIGGTIAVFVGKHIILPIKKITDAFDEISVGNFSVRVPETEKISEIRELAQRFNSMTYDLSHIETLRNDFAANVSHEFKTPIASIEGYATLLQDKNITAEKHDRYVEKILDNSRRLANLSSSILMLSKLENQEMIVDKKEFRIDEQIRKAVLMLESQWTAKNIEFDMDLPKQIYFGSEQILFQVWSNIIDNAVKFSPTGGIIKIDMETNENELAIKISDSGIGMTEEVQKHIFDKFYQGDTSRKTEGNGLGLALVHKITELCGGSVSVKSFPDKGAEFTVILPM